MKKILITIGILVTISLAADIDMIIDSIGLKEVWQYRTSPNVIIIDNKVYNMVKDNNKNPTIRAKELIKIDQDKIYIERPGN